MTPGHAVANTSVVPLTLKIDNPNRPVEACAANMDSPWEFYVGITQRDNNSLKNKSCIVRERERTH